MTSPDTRERPHCGDAPNYTSRWAARHTAWAMLAITLGLGSTNVAQALGVEDNISSVSGPVRLVSPDKSRPVDDETQEQDIKRQDPQQGRTSQREDIRSRSSRRPQRDLVDPETGRPLPYPPLSEFERYVEKNTAESVEIRRFGTELLTKPSAQQPEGLSQIPSDYVVSIGDELLISVWGSVEADLRLVVDRSGRITIPRVGPILVAGLRYAELNAAIDRRMKLVFKNYQLSTALGKLRSIRVYVTGFTAKPGAYTVNSLSTIVNAIVQAGGPSSAGSFRNIELRRGGTAVSNFDLYDLLLRGDKKADRVLQAEDVIHIGPVADEVALIGSVNRQGIFELKPGETIEELLQMGGGFNAVADRGRLAVESLDLRSDVRIAEVRLPTGIRTPVKGGSLVRAFNAVDVNLPQQRQNKRVRVEGEVQRPGEYILPPGSTLMDAIRAAGGLTNGAFVYGTEFTRESVRVTQQAQYERALRDLETEFARIQGTQKALTADEASAQSARAQGSVRLIERLRAVRPTGRVVLQLPTNATALPDLPLENGDRLSVPPQPTTVGVFGSVFNGGSFVYRNGASLDDMVRLAGGPTRGADASSIFVIRADGSVVSAKQQSGGWLSTGSSFSTLSAQPGDTVFVPEDLTKVTFTQEAKEWTQILYQFGLGAAALKTIKN